MNDEILARIRKILAKAEDPAASAAEAETYTAKAAELVARYGIDRALLAQKDPASDAVGDRVVVLDPAYALDKAGLLNRVAAELRCQAVQRTRYLDGAKELSLHLFGFDSDLQRAELLYTSLLLQATWLLARTAAPPGESVAAYRRSWLAGFTTAIGRRLAEAERRAREAAAPRGTEQAPGTPDPGGRVLALVLADRTAQVNRATSTAYPFLRSAPRRSLSGSGGTSGYAAEQRADLAGTGVPASSGRQRLTGRPQA